MKKALLPFLLMLTGVSLFSWKLWRRVEVLEHDVADYAVARRSYSDRFVARNHKTILILTPRALIFKRRGYASLRLEIVVDKKSHRLKLKAS